MSFLDIFKETKDALVDSATTRILDSFARTYINGYLNGILEVHEIKIAKKRPVITFTLEGVPDYVHTAQVGRIEISEDGRKLELGDFRCNTPFIENALNKFAAGSFAIPNDKAALALAGVRKVLL